MIQIKPGVKFYVALRDDFSGDRGTRVTFLGYVADQFPTTDRDGFFRYWPANEGQTYDDSLLLEVSAIHKDLVSGWHTVAIPEEEEQP